MSEAKDQARVRETAITAALYNAATDYAAYVTSNRRDYDEVMKLTAALEAAAVAYAEIAGDRQAEAVQTAELKPVRFSEWLGGNRENQLLLPNDTKIRFCNALDALRSHAAEGTSGECAACSTYLRHGDGDLCEQGKAIITKELCFADTSLELPPNTAISEPGADKPLQIK